MNQIIKLSRIADLGAEFITLAEAKTQLRVTFTDDDAEITALIKKARRYVENYCNISIVYQRIQLIAVLVESWKLPYGPVIGIESVADNSNSPSGSGPASYATSTTNWGVDGDLFTPGGVSGYYGPVGQMPVSDRCYTPLIRTQVTYTAGNFCPDDLKDVILEVLAFLYENRGLSTGENDKNASLAATLSKADAYRVALWF